jgi:hypothetical protein
VLSCNEAAPELLRGRFFSRTYDAPKRKKSGARRNQRRYNYPMSQPNEEEGKNHKTYLAAAMIGIVAVLSFAGLVEGRLAVRTGPMCLGRV